MITVLAYDFGTTSLKAAVVSGGAIVAEANSTYPVLQKQPGWAEQDPDRLWQAAASTGREALVRSGLAASAIEGIIFVAPWKAIIPVSGDGARLGDAMIWLDGRAGAQAEQLNRDAGRFVGTGQEYWPRLMWLKEHQPEAWLRARWIMGLTSYLRWRATGVVVTEPSDDFIRSTSPGAQRQLSQIVDAAGLREDLAKFPPQVEAASVVGGVQSQAAAELGIPAGTPVVVGFGDLPAITLGAESSAPGDAHLYFGTSAWLAIVESQGGSIDAPLHFSLDAQTRVAVFAQQTGGLAYDWIVEQVYGAEKAHLSEGIQALVNHEVAEVPPGSANLLATHWLNGELPPLSKEARGVFINLNSSHDRRHMVRAMMESICFGHRVALESLEAKTGARQSELSVVGGGATSDLWMQMLADVLERTVVVQPNPRYAGVLGAYACALRALRPEASPVSAERGPALRRFEPNPEHRAVYDRMYRAHRMIYPALNDVFRELNAPDIQNNLGEPQ